METEANTKRTFKDSVFRMLLTEPENALAVYNALNGTNYTDTSQLTYNTLENAIFMNIKNDVSFIIGLDMLLYEHQSTYTPNMPLRDLFYIADLLHVHIKDETLYSPKLISIPTPYFFVFYNGTTDYPDKMILKLSDSFENPIDNPQLELVVTMLNINSGHNEQLLENCTFLKEYAVFVDKTRTYNKIMSIEDAVKTAVDDCIQNNILRDFLLRQKAEVIKVSIYEFDAEREYELINKAWKEIMEENIQKAVKEAILDAAAKVSEAEHKVSEAEHKASLATKLLTESLQQQGKSKSDIIKLLQTQCSLSEQEATEQVELYWQ